MSKKHNPTKPCQPYQPRPIKVADKAGDELQFPANQHIATNPQREVPNPAAALAGLGQPQPSERARLRAATLSQEQRDARAQREAPVVMAAAEPPAQTVQEDLQAVKRRPWDAPMATRIGSLPDPLAVLAWDAIVEDAAATARKWWDKWRFAAALSVWSAACFLLGTLA